MNFVHFAIALLFFSAPVYAYVCGYARLFKPGTKTTVDVLYDAHKQHPQKGLSPSEKKLDHILTTLNTRTKGVDVVWEWNDILASNSQQVTDCFIWLHPPRIIKNLRNINFISSDTCRLSGYAGLFKWQPGYRFENSVGSSFAEPVPFGSQRRRRLLAQAGKTAFDKYEALYSLTVNKLDRYFSYYRKNGMRLNLDRDYYENDDFHAIADLEMLYNILVSEKERIIVYCGGWHASNIAAFLINNGYRVLNASKVWNWEVEVRPNELDFMYRD